MLKSVKFKNFRCFDQHTVDFENKSLVVGKNNAGKSTCIEGLRLLSLVTQRLGNLPVKSPPHGLGLYSYRDKGVSPSLESISIKKECLFFRYGDPPGVVIGEFSNGSSIEVYIGDGPILHALIRDSKGKIAKSKPATALCGIPKVSIMPQIGPVQGEETRRTDATIRRNLETNLTSLHFRNQLRLLKSEHFDHFCELASNTWPGLRVARLEEPDIMDKEAYHGLIVREGDFSAEIAWMGHGMQMWLQTMWFLARCKDSSVLILDEPDVYMHADLQRKLIRLLLQDDRQFIIATHSAEMMSEVPPSSVVILDRQKERSRPATSIKGVQTLLDNVGSVHNLSLARIGIHRKILLVEGKDVPVLKKFQDAMGNYGAIPIDSLPHAGIGGWSKWPSVVTMAQFFQKNAPDDLQIFCVLDRDYHTEDEIQTRLIEADKHKICLTVWSAKELENYIIKPEPIQRLLVSEGVKVTIDDVRDSINRNSEALRNQTIDSVSEAIRITNRGWGANKSNPLAREYIKDRARAVGLEMIVNGKELFSAVIGELQAEHKKSFSLGRVLREMRSEDVHIDIVTFLNSLESSP